MSERTCATCKHIGNQYWGDDYSPIHHCGKSDARRAAQFVSCGDRAQDFMNEFRRFYDAGPGYKACQFYQEREPSNAETLAILQQVKDAGGRKAFQFFSNENRVATRLNGRFLKDETSRTEMNGHRAYRLTAVGEAELALTIG